MKKIKNHKFFLLDFRKMLYICRSKGKGLAKRTRNTNTKTLTIMSICSCPAGASLPSVPNAACPQDFGQIQKIIFQRIFSTGTTKNSFSTQKDIKKLASWTPLMTASDGTKAVITPYVEAPASDGGDAITFGGGNDTLGGATKIIGRNPVNMTFAIRQMTQNVIKALKGLQCEDALGVYLVNADGQIMALKDTATATTYYPIPIRSLFVGDLMLNGLDNPDENALSFSFAPNWSDDAVVVSPEFNPLTDLANAE